MMASPIPLLAVVLAIGAYFSPTALADVTVGHKQQYDELVDDLKKAIDRKEKLERYLDYKEQIYADKLREIEAAEKLTSGETYTEVTRTEAINLANEAMEGVTTYLSNNGIARLEATENLINQADSVKKIVESQIDFIDYMDGRQLESLIADKAQIERQMQSAKNELYLLESTVIPATNHMIDEHVGSIGSTLERILERAVVIAAQCDTYRSSRSVVEINCRDDVVTTPVRTLVGEDCDDEGDEGDEGNCIPIYETTYRRDFYCVCSRMSVCAGASPNQACSCPAQPMTDSRRSGKC